MPHYLCSAVLALLLVGGCAVPPIVVNYSSSVGWDAPLAARVRVEVQPPTQSRSPKLNGASASQSVKQDLLVSLFPNSVESGEDLLVKAEFEEVSFSTNALGLLTLSSAGIAAFVWGGLQAEHNTGYQTLGMYAVGGTLIGLGAILPIQRYACRAALRTELVCPDGKKLKSYRGVGSFSCWGNGFMRLDVVAGEAVRRATEGVKQQVIRDRSEIAAAVQEQTRRIPQPVVAKPPETLPIDRIQLVPKLASIYVVTDASGDRILDGGEKVHIRVTVYSSGQGGASGVKVKLSGTSKALSYLGTEQSLGDISPGESAIAVFERVLPNDVPADEGTIIIRVTEANGYNALEEKELHVAMQPAKVKREVEYVSGLVDVDQPLTANSYRQSDAYAVIVGVSNYATTGIPLVKYAVRDAEAMKDYLVGVCGVPEENIKMVTDAQATRSKIEALVTDWLGRNITKSGQTVYIYFAGHGTPSPDKGDAYLVPYDGDPELPSTLYAVSSFYNALNKLASNNIIVALDACFSGAGGRSVIAQGKRPIVAVKMPEVDQKLAVLTASAASEISQDYDAKRHGLFTYWILKALRGEADTDRDGWVTLGELYDYIKPHVEEESRKLGYSQTPQLLAEPQGEKAGMRLARVR